LKRVILLGGGHAHVHVLQAVAREPIGAAEVLLVSPHARAVYSGMVPGVVAGHYRPEQGQIALDALAAAARVPWVAASALHIDAGARCVHLSNGQVVGYDLLSIDTGATVDRERIPGARQHALFVRPIEGFITLFDAVVDLAARRVLDVVVVGGGAAGVEMALAVQHRLAGRGEERARVALVTGGEPPLAGYAPVVMERAARALARGKVTVFREACVRIEPGTLFLASGARLACDAPLIATGPAAPAWLAPSGLALDERGYIATGATLQSLSHPEVLAVGDVASRSDAPHPKSGVHAVRAGPPLLANLRAAAGGVALQAHAPQARTLNLISTGRRHAIASWGRWSAEGRWVWWWKDHIDRGFVARFTRT
jgi:pyridine nucleotide-disulfide oxidoreductase family protein